LQIDYLIALFALLLNLYMCLLLELVSKYDDNWRHVYNLFFSKNIFVNNNISCDWKALKYVAINNTIVALILQKQETILLKENFVNIFRHVSIAISNR